MAYEKLKSLLDELDPLRSSQERPQILEILKFESFAEQVDELMKVAPHINQDVYNKSVRSWVPGTTNYDTNYVGRLFKNWGEVREAAGSFWPHGMEVLQSMKEQIQDCELPRPQNIRRTRVWREDQGDELSLDRLQRGQPYWQTTHRDHRPGPLSVTIVADTVISRYQEPDIVLWRGAAVVCLTQILEEAGYRVELWAADMGYNCYEDGRDSGVAVCLKQTADPIDESTLINAMSGWSHRTISFGSRWHCGKPHNNLGHCGSLDPILPHITTDQQAIICGNVWSKEKATEWIRKEVEKFDPRDRS